jgi:tetratricopeptide (TPR) repeat protein
MKIFIALFLAVLCTFQGGAARAKPRPLTPPQTRDTWRSVRTNNLFVIGNADAEKLRQVAVWLEFFHSAFARLVSRNVIDSSVPTTVVVFRDEASFIPFKPLYQGRPANISGFFQPGEDVNYIAISLDPRERDPYSTAFHEYIHLHLKDNVPGVPVWLNEGLAEFYGSLQFSGGEALLGAPLGHYLRLLRNQEMLPLTTLLSINTSSPHYNEQDKSGMFYGESWALVHYLMLGGGPGRPEQFKRFLQQVARGDDAAKAIESSFGMSLAAVERELESYVRREDLPSLRLASGDDPQAYASYTAMQRQSLSEGEANYYLGDLLLHIGRESDAERYFKQAIALDPNFVPPYAALGQIAVHQQQYADAKKYLQKAVTTPQNYLIHYLYAFVLSREGMTPSGHITEYSRENAAVMREQLQRAIKLKPDFASAYYILAIVDLTTEQLDEALAMAQKARQLAPGKSTYTLLLAEIYARRSDTTSARALLEPLTRDTNTEVRAEAQKLIDWLNRGGAADQSAGGASRSSAPVGSAMMVEPVESKTSRGLSGSSTGGGTAIRDGQTIQSSGSLPTLDQLLAKYVEAMGGEKAIRAATTRLTKGTLDVPGISRGGSFEIYEQAPNKSLTILQAHPLGTVKIGFNGRNGWSQTTTGVKPIKAPTELSSLQRDSDTYAPLRLKQNFAKVSFPGMSQIGYREVYVLDLQPAVGTVERLYLDAKTYLPVRMNTVRKLGVVLVPVEIYYDDWKAVDGIQFPFSISQRFQKLTLSFTVKEIRHNVPLEASLFEPPVR